MNTLKLYFRQDSKFTQTPPAPYVADGSLYVLDTNNEVLFNFQPPENWGWRIIESEKKTNFDMICVVLKSNASITLIRG